MAGDQGQERHDETPGGIAGPRLTIHCRREATQPGSVRPPGRQPMTASAPEIPVPSTPRPNSSANRARRPRSANAAAILWLLLAIVPRACFAEDSARSRPNIIVIIADDLGCDDVAPYHASAARTPNLARLGREGMRFDRAFLTCSSCSPSRASLITARYPHATGACELHQPLPADQVTFVERLRTGGYWTAAAGKWHLGPHARKRFDLVVEAAAPLPPDVPRDGSGCEHWLPTLDRRPADKPFFLWLAAVDPHRDYADGAVSPPHRPEDVSVPPYYPDTPAVRRDLALYYDEIARLDGYVGRLLDALAARQLANDTVVLFMTDNGRPFPRSKTTVYDSGIRTPLLVRWPAGIAPGSVCGALVSSVDIGPTLVELAGAEPAASFQGRSFARLLGDPAGSIRPAVFAEHNWHDFTARERAARDLRYKLIVNERPDLPGTPPADAVRGTTFQEMRRLRDEGRLPAAAASVFATPRPREELYDLDADPHELTNLADDPRHEPALRRLREELATWSRETGDTSPQTLTRDMFDRETGRPLRNE